MYLHVLHFLFISVIHPDELSSRTPRFQSDTPLHCFTSAKLREAAEAQSGQLKRASKIERARLLTTASEVDEKLFPEPVSGN